MREVLSVFTFAIGAFCFVMFFITLTPQVIAFPGPSKALISGRSLVVERNLFRRADQDIKNFVDETRISIRRVGD